MEKLYKKYIAQHLVLILLTAFSLSLILARIAIVRNGFYAFLIWNLFLAYVPLIITKSFLIKNWRTSKITFFFGFVLWLLFLPNSPYIITDLIHLHNEKSNLVWLDLFLVFVFAINGLLTGILSLLDMHVIITNFLSKKITQFVLFIACILSGFGIYLGRFLRLNSWDALIRLHLLIKKKFIHLSEPMTWSVTLAFGIFFWIIYKLFESYHSPKASKRFF